ncbi:TetR/AcrR family transcriptional regulator [Actinocrispum wychmicini]|uniref:TetR/AcrR family transcriptional regulator n=1 Tax=Actinocrispum wychmicini TaxID=1213861 RepID=UPI0014049437|nr:TetR/AcrR family transcriptional regulator [Actinocrispum wychmicini]
MDVSDLTARARIRDAALRRFGADGFAATPVRRIAADAKVSAALVVHHFGSKQGLVEACDLYAMAFARNAHAHGKATDGGNAVLSYLARAMVERAQDTASMFDEMVVATEQMLASNNARPVEDPKLRAAVLVSLELGGFALRAHLSRYLGMDAVSQDGFERIGQLVNEMVTQGVFE